MSTSQSRQLPPEILAFEPESVKLDLRVTRQPSPADWRWQPTDRREILLGRVLAACVHPFSAWRFCARFWRLWILFAYATAGYVIVLGLLLALWPA